jgi:hypothetical protein
MQTQLFQQSAIRFRIGIAGSEQFVSVENRIGAS